MTDEELIDIITTEFKEELIVAMPDNVDFTDFENFAFRGELNDVIKGLICLNAQLFTKIKLLERDIYGEA